MILLQHIKVYWNKDFRGAPYSTARNNMLKAYPLPEGFFSHIPKGFSSHFIYLSQTKDGFEESMNRRVVHPEKEYIKCSALEISRCEHAEHAYQVKYRYSYHRAAPRRQTYNKNNGVMEELEEIAMVLEPEEYGRILYNGRYTDFDTGEWYYILDIINIISTSFPASPLDVFTRRIPDKQYQQIALLT